MTRLRRLIERRDRMRRELATVEAQIAAETRRISDAGGWRVVLRPEQALVEIERAA